MVATPILLRATPRVPVAPPEWTFSYTGTIFGASYTGHLGKNSLNAGPLSDSDDLADTSIFGTSGGASSITASFGNAAYKLTTVTTRNIETAHPDSWGPTFTDGRTVQSSIDGRNWTTIGTISGSADGSNRNMSAGGIYARYVRIVNTSTFFGIGTFKFS